MLDSLPDRVLDGVRRIGHLGRRSPRDFRRWIEQTSDLLHLSVLLFVPLLIVVVTTLANTVEPLSFLLFPSLAAGTYTLFANPGSKYASPRRFVSGLTVGALCGWAAMELDVLAGGGSIGGSISPAGSLGVAAVTAGTAVFLTSAVTWALDVEEASAFSTALLGLLVPDGQALAFVASVAVASTIVAAVFTVWRKQFYHQRARLLYESTDGGDHIIVPMVGESPNETAMLAGRLAAAHDAGKVVLLDFVSDDDIERTKRDLIGDRSGDGPGVTDGGRGTDAVATDAQRTNADDSIDRTNVRGRSGSRLPRERPTG